MEKTSTSPTSPTSPTSCSICKSKIMKYTEKKAYGYARNWSKDKTHYHYGIPFYTYGICEVYHLNKDSLTKIVWNPCIRCNIKGFSEKKNKPVKSLKKEEKDEKDDEKEEKDDEKEDEKETEYVSHRELELLKDDFETLRQEIQALKQDLDAAINTSLTTILEKPEKSEKSEKKRLTISIQENRPKKILKTPKSYHNTPQAQDSEPATPASGGRRKFSKFKRK